MRLVIDLDFPPSANRLWRKRFDRVYPSIGYKNFQKQSGIHWMLQKKGPFKTITDKFTAEIILIRPDKRKRDCENYQKAPMDTLQKLEIIDDDCNCTSITSRWGDEEEAPFGCRVIITTVSG